ncbi:MAG TPA: DoxX family protein [Candidatus Limnocylindria bacterium]|nr:DoxX family protein [Candidatus Limnocylindria bacterium]
MKTQIVRKDTVVADPPLARFLFSDTRMAPVWFLVRIFVGFSWLDAGWHKITDIGVKTNYIIDGQGILAFWQRIAAIPAAPAKPVISYDFYRSAIQFMIDNHWEGFFGKLIAFGETAVGLGLIFGAFVGIAAVGGAFMNLNFMLAGSTSSNPVLLLLGFLLVLAWKTAGYIGIDRYLLPILGTPWKGVRLTAPVTARQVTVHGTT